MNPKKVVVTSTSFAKKDDEPIQLLKKHNWEPVFCKGPFDDEQLAPLVKDADAVIVGIDRVGPKTLAAAKQLKVIVKHGTGTDNIDVDEAEKVGIKVLNAPHTNAIAVAEYVFASIFHLIRPLSAACESLKNGNWDGPKYTGLELHQKTLGVVGFGHIGQITAQIGKGFGMDVLYYDLFRNHDAEKELDVTYKPLDELLPMVDIISLHVPLSPGTKNMFDTEEFAKMKPSVYIINVARGGVVNEKALYQALVNNRIGGAVLDVFEEEPMQHDSPFLKLTNTICTPHLAGYTIESCKRTSLIAAQNLVKEFPLEKERL